MDKSKKNYKLFVSVDGYMYDHVTKLAEELKVSRSAVVYEILPRGSWLGNSL